MHGLPLSLPPPDPIHSLCECQQGVARVGEAGNPILTVCADPRLARRGINPSGVKWFGFQAVPANGLPIT